MSSISSVASTSSVLRPAALFCTDCVPSAVTMDPHKQDTLQFSWTLCVIHLADLHAAPLNPYQQDLQPPPTQSSPTHPITFSTANRAINTGAGPVLTLDQATPQSQPAPLSVPAPFSRTAVVQFSTDLYEKIRLTVMDPRDRQTIKGALAKHGVYRPTSARPSPYLPPIGARPSPDRRPTYLRPSPYLPPIGARPAPDRPALSIL